MALGLTQPLTEMSTRNTSWGGECDRRVGLTTLPPSCADCFEIWEPQPPGTLKFIQCVVGFSLHYLTFPTHIWFCNLNSYHISIIPSGRTMALGLTRPLTEMSTRNTSWGGECDRCVGLTTLPPSCADCFEIWEPPPPGTLKFIRCIVGFSLHYLTFPTHIWFCNLNSYHISIIPSGRNMALGSTQPLTEMSTRNTSWGGECGRCVRLTTLPPSCADCLEIWEPQPPGTLKFIQCIVGFSLHYLTFPTHIWFCNLNSYHISIIPSSRTMAPGVDSASNKNEYQEYFLGGGMEAAGA